MKLNTSKIKRLSIVTIFSILHPSDWIPRSVRRKTLTTRKWLDSFQLLQWKSLLLPLSSLRMTRRQPRRNPMKIPSKNPLLLTTTQIILLKAAASGRSYGNCKWVPSGNISILATHLSKAEIAMKGSKICCISCRGRASFRNIWMLWRSQVISSWSCPVIVSSSKFWFLNKVPLH